MIHGPVSTEGNNGFNSLPYNSSKSILNHTLKNMVKYHSPKEYLDAAKSDTTSPDELDNLSKSAYSFVRVAVASNKNAREETLSALLPEKIESYYDQEIANALANNPGTPQNILAVLAERFIPVLDNGRKHRLAFYAGLCLCSNPHTPIKSIQVILEPSNVSKEFRKVVARETNRQDVLAFLLNDPSSRVQRKLKQRIML